MGSLFLKSTYQSDLHNRVRFAQNLARRFFKNLIIALSLTLFLSCGDGQGGDNNGVRRGRGSMFSGMDSGVSAAIPVQVAAAQKGDISTFLMQTTTIEAERQVEILAKVAGQVIRLPIEEGTRVKKGDLLTQLDEAELKIAYIQAKVSMETDKSALDRAKEMLEKNLIAEENYQTTLMQYESSKASFEAARLKLDYTNVRSPIDGVVTVRSVEMGQRVNINQVLFTIADFEPLRAKIYVPEKDMRRVFEGQAARIIAEAEPEVEFSGVVKMVSPVVDPASGTAKVTIDIKDDKGKLKPGMFASVFITTETHSNALLIPKKAMILETDMDQVYVYQEGTAHKVNLKLGFTSGDNVEVLSGLQEGDLVVIAGQEGLREGLPIRIPGEAQAITSRTPEVSESSRMADGEGEPRSPQNFSQGRPGNRRPGQGRARFGGNGPVDPQRLQRMEARLMQNPEIKKEYEKRLKEDPELATDPEKKMAFFREMFGRMRQGQGRR
ncbi:MAG: efflux RND transporter periplasmic adaptor subunit [bacterium]